MWPWEFHGLYSPWGHKESDTTEWLSLSKQGRGSLSSSSASIYLSSCFIKGAGPDAVGEFLAPTLKVPNPPRLIIHEALTVPVLSLRTGQKWVSLVLWWTGPLVGEWGKFYWEVPLLFQSGRPALLEQSKCPLLIDRAVPWFFWSANQQNILSLHPPDSLPGQRWPFVNSARLSFLVSYLLQHPQLPSSRYLQPLKSIFTVKSPPSPFHRWVFAHSVSWPGMC